MIALGLYDRYGRRLNDLGRIPQSWFSMRRVEFENWAIIRSLEMVQAFVYNLGIIQWSWDNFTIVASLIKGYFFHQHSKDEALGDLDLYKMECSRLWRYLDSEIGLSKVYLTFYELILQKIKSHLNGTYSGWGSPKLGIIGPVNT